MIYDKNPPKSYGIKKDSYFFVTSKETLQDSFSLVSILAMYYAELKVLNQADFKKVTSV